jgi:hypothetical protein
VVYASEAYTKTPVTSDTRLLFWGYQEHKIHVLQDGTENGMSYSGKPFER